VKRLNVLVSLCILATCFSEKEEAMPTLRNTSTSEYPFVSSSRAKSLWRNRDYLFLWSGQALSDMGGAVSGLAFPLLLLAVTQSPAQAGFGAALRAVPALLFTLFAGVIVDRWDRKRVMLVCEIPTIWLAWAWLLVTTVIVTVIPQVRREHSH
jgi:hypothetical protein